MFLFILINVSFIVFLFWLLDKFINIIFNIISLIKKDTFIHEGMVYNSNDKILE